MGAWDMSWDHRGSSSGGFSNYWSRPSHQDAAVEGYFKSGTSLPNAKLWNRTVAGFPDVAAQAANFSFYFSGKEYNGICGTSGASPSFTGIISLVNEMRLAVGKKPLGYLNRLIYEHLGPRGAFTDITSGSNPGCGTSGFH